MRDEGILRPLSGFGALSGLRAVREPPAQSTALACRGLLSIGAVVLTLAGPLAVTAAASETAAQAAGQHAVAIKDRHVDVSRAGATEAPRSEGDQALVDGWPLYRTARGQGAFNDAMATLKATDGASPAAAAFKDCPGLSCNLLLPAIGPEGWIPPGRIWVSPAEYVLIAHSPRLRDGQRYRRRAYRDMRYFVFHEFHNSTRNTDTFDTISSHSGSVFVPFYMSKQGTDAAGRRFVIVVQVAPYDVVSIHATDKGSAGPGIEVAKNVTDTLEPLQGLAGVLVATIVKTAAPHLEVVNHGGNEGLPMLTEYERRLEKLRGNPGSATLALPFAAAPEQRVAAATARLEDLIVRRGASPLVAMAERGIVQPRDKVAVSAMEPMRSASTALDPEPKLIGPIRPAIRPAPAQRPEPTLIEPIRPAVRPAALSSSPTLR